LFRADEAEDQGARQIASSDFEHSLPLQVGPRGELEQSFRLIRGDARLAAGSDQIRCVLIHVVASARVFHADRKPATEPRHPK
jgi:hypothetical protein